MFYLQDFMPDRRNIKNLPISQFGKKSVDVFLEVCISVYFNLISTYGYFLRLQNKATEWEQNEQHPWKTKKNTG